MVSDYCYLEASWSYKGSSLGTFCLESILILYVRYHDLSKYDVIQAVSVNDFGCAEDLLHLASVTGAMINI